MSMKRKKRKMLALTLASLTAYSPSPTLPLRRAAQALG
jgi:hypothetical protein